jgi:hypothetical protein
MRAEYRGEFAAIRSDMRVLNLKVNLIIAALVVIGSPSLWLLVRIAAKTGALPG